MKHSSAPFVLALLLWVTPVQAAKCPLYSYIAQPGQDPVGLLKLEASSEDALRSQIPGAPSGKLCWYTSPEGLLFAEPPKGNKRYIFRRTEGRWSFSETQDLIIVVGWGPVAGPNNSSKPTPLRGAA